MAEKCKGLKVAGLCKITQSVTAVAYCISGQIQYRNSGWWKKSEISPFIVLKRPLFGTALLDLLEHFRKFSKKSKFFEIFLSRKNAQIWTKIGSKTFFYFNFVFFFTKNTTLRAKCSNFLKLFYVFGAKTGFFGFGALVGLSI